MTTSYDELPYEDRVFPYAQPGNLATVAALYGLDPPPLHGCRVLDIGCAGGANLLPTATTYPGAELVGLDLSPRQIAAGRETVARLGLTNVALHARNLLDPTDDLGRFDYIICHGVYSWVPPPVADRILDVVRRHLTPRGIAYISYNTYPGWHLRGLARDFLAFHAAGLSGSPAELVDDARNVLKFLADGLPGQGTAYQTFLLGEADHLRPLRPSYVYHEYLEADNHPVYFHQFAAHAAAHQLRYLAEAAPQPLPGVLRPEVVATLAKITDDPIRLEQYFDFLRCRVFRRSLLCHDAERPDPFAAADRIAAFAMTTACRPEAETPDSDPAKAEKFAVSGDREFVTADPLARSILWKLATARPAAVPFADLLRTIGTGAAELANCLFHLYLADLVRLYQHPPTVAVVAGHRPSTSPFARFQAGRGNSEVFNVYGHGVEPDEVSLALLPLLDGRRTREELAVAAKLDEAVVAAALDRLAIEALLTA